MAQFIDGDVSIHYEIFGEGLPLLLLSPGGMDSSIEMWERVTISPLVTFAGEFKLIAMDQRNAGTSTGPFPVEDPWGSYVADQLHLMDHLGIEHFVTFGCCIGCSYQLKIEQVAPGRQVAAVLEQPIGITTAAYQQRWVDVCNKFVEAARTRNPVLTTEDGQRFSEAMWADGDFVVSVSRESAHACEIPLLVLPGGDEGHPYEIGVEVAELAPNAEIIDPWRDTPERLANTIEQTRGFLNRHAV
jgi:pimeloyl-ACP methyl ester carboxylesterase